MFLVMAGAGTRRRAADRIAGIRGLEEKNDIFAKMAVDLFPAMDL